MDRVRDNNRRAAMAGLLGAAFASGWLAVLCVGFVPAAASASAPDPGPPPAPRVAAPVPDDPTAELAAGEGSEGAAVSGSEATATDDAMAAVLDDEGKAVVDGALTQVGAWLVLHDDQAVEEALAVSSQKKAEMAERASQEAVSAAKELQASAVSCGVSAAACCGAAAGCFVVGRRRVRAARQNGGAGMLDHAMGVVRG